MLEETPVTKEERCCVCNSDKEVKRCGGCKATVYCSKQCQKSHRSYHAVYCSAISDLYELEVNKLYRDFSVRQQQVDVKTQTKLVKLVGEKPMLRCRLDGKVVEMLWDTGSMISLVGRKWVKRNFPQKKIYSVREFLEEKEELKVTAANSSEVNVDGVILFYFSVGEGEDGFVIPVLVSSEEVVQPILGYNVIEHLILKGSRDQQVELESSLQRNKSEFKVNSLATLVQGRAANPDYLSDIKAQSTVRVPAGRKVQIKCRVKTACDDTEQTVYFSPCISESDEELTYSETVCKLKRGHTNHVLVDVMNLSNREKVLKRGTIIGSVHSVAAVIPMISVTDKKVQKSKSEGGEVSTVEAKVDAIGAEKVGGKCEKSGGSENKQSGDLAGLGDQDHKDSNATWDLSHLKGKQRFRSQKVKVGKCQQLRQKWMP